MKIAYRHSIILVLLVVLFAAPGLSALFVYYHPQWLGTGTINKGTLLSPPIELTELGSDAKWHLIFWSPQVCEASCLEQLDKLARVRLALGRRLYNVNLSLLLGSNVEVPTTIQGQLDGLQVKTNKLSSDASINALAHYQAPRLFISNPDNYLVLAYPQDVQPDDVFHDIKLLLSKGN